MNHASIDALISPTLKHLRERWWDDEFTEFLTETLRPRPGNRILDVGCGAGAGEVSIGRLHVSQLRLYGVDLRVGEAIAAAGEVAAHNVAARFAAGDACRLPFADASFDSTYCVAVLQHVADVPAAVREFSRVTAEGGRVLAVEPDNAAHYAYSSVASGAVAFGLAARLFAASAAARGDTSDPAVGPTLPKLFAEHGIEPNDVRLFPVSNVTLGMPAAEIWARRRATAQALTSNAAAAVRTLAGEYLSALAAYEAAAAAAGQVFVEIQNTMLFATSGQKAG
jgi:SAM-dependent methyltransferase